MKKIFIGLFIFLDSRRIRSGQALKEHSAKLPDFQSFKTHSNSPSQMTPRKMHILVMSF